MARKIETERRIGSGNDRGDLFEIETPLDSIMEIPGQNQLPGSWWERVREIGTPLTDDAPNH